MNYIRVNTPEGQFDIPCLEISKIRANYYAEIDGHEIGSDEYNKEVIYASNDEFECIDWLVNNSNWEDWEGIAVKINDKVLHNVEEFWTSTDEFEMIKK